MSNSIANAIHTIKETLPSTVELIAVSKTKPISDIELAYNAGQRHFGENKAQEVIEKGPVLPKDIKWHFIGHLQSKKVKQIIPHTYLIHSIDSLKLLEEVNKRAGSIEKIQQVLLQVHIAEEENKFGLNRNELEELIKISAVQHKNVCIVGLMGMATFTSNSQKISSEFQLLKTIFDEIKADHFKDEDSFRELSMGMSGDYELAISMGSTMVRIGSSIFGSRNY